MLPFRQLLSTVSLALLVLHQQQSFSGTGQALARPVQPNTNATEPSFEVLTTEPRTSIPAPDDDSQATVDPEAVLKALQVLTDGIQMQQADEGQEKAPVMVISHGEGGPINSSADQQSGADSKGSSTNNDAIDKSSDDDKSIKKNKSNQSSHSKKDNDKKKSAKDSAKAIQAMLQQPRTRFCAQAANTNQTIDDISQTLVRKERKRLARIREQRAAASKSKNNSTDARSLTDARLLAEESKTVQVVWHVIHSGTAGNLTMAMVNDQVQVLNEDYKSYGFGFNLNATNYVDNANWYRNADPGSSAENQMKVSLRQGDAKTLNLYSVDFNNGLLGFSSFPWDVQSDLTNDGIVFQYSTVPGGSETGYNLGKTVTHEVGHWLGLYHVFQGGCQSPGDYVADTPPQSVATSGCPTGQDSCRGGGADSIHK